MNNEYIYDIKNLMHKMGFMTFTPKDIVNVINLYNKCLISNIRLPNNEEMNKLEKLGKNII